MNSWLWSDVNSLHPRAFGPVTALSHSQGLMCSQWIQFKTKHITGLHNTKSMENKTLCLICAYTLVPPNCLKHNLNVNLVVFTLTSQVLGKAAILSDPRQPFVLQQENTILHICTHTQRCVTGTSTHTSFSISLVMFQILKRATPQHLSFKS